MKDFLHRLLRWDESLREAFVWMGSFLPGLFLRGILAFEYLQSGWEKYRGDNWFGDIQSQFPFPFNVIPVDISWFIATWFELVGGVLLVLGLGTRYVAATLLVLTFVAAYAVHFPMEWHSFSDFWMGYAVSDDGYGNYKLPLLFFIMFLALVGYGPGRLSLDHWIARRNGLV
ncbi:MAG: HvfX family Cu-binding RiPP maturation protein [Moraxellaceae bacterium]